MCWARGVAVRRFFSFPNPVNDYAARTVAGGVVIMTIAVLALGYVGEKIGLSASASHNAWWILVPLAYGFWGRVLTGPKLSPLGLLATRVVAPAIARTGRKPKLVPGPPKRFAQGIGVAFSSGAAVLALGFHLYGAAAIVLGLLLVAATLESVFAFCLGCTVFQGLMRIGIVPESVCEECNNIWARQRPTAGAANL
jgi:hypothetical protein